MQMNESHTTHQRCGAKTRSGEPCQAWAMANGRCRMHGGNQKSGIARHNYKHGKYSKALPQRMLASYEGALADPDLITMRAEIAVLDARLEDLIKRADQGGAGRLWRELSAAWDDFRDANTTQDQDRIAVALNRVNRIIRRGITDFATWNEIEHVINLRRRVVAEERRRLVDLQQMMTYEQAMSLAGAMLDAARKTIHDRNTLAAFQREFTRLIGRTD